MRTPHAIALVSFLIGGALTITFNDTEGAVGVFLRVLAMGLGLGLPVWLLIKYNK